MDGAIGRDEAARPWPRQSRAASRRAVVRRPGAGARRPRSRRRRASTAAGAAACRARRVERSAPVARYVATGAGWSPRTGTQHGKVHDDGFRAGTALARARRSAAALGRRPRGADPVAAILERAAADLEDDAARADGALHIHPATSEAGEEVPELVDMRAAVALSGYTRGHLRRMIGARTLTTTVPIPARCSVRLNCRESRAIRSSTCTRRRRNSGNALCKRAIRATPREEQTCLTVAVSLESAAHTRNKNS